MTGEPSRGRGPDAVADPTHDAAADPAHDAVSDPASGSQTTVVDARGTACPMPIILLARAAQGAAAGTELTVLATDVAARLDVPAWARMTGHTFVGEKETDGGALALTVRLGG